MKKFPSGWKGATIQLSVSGGKRLRCGSADSIDEREAGFCVGLVDRFARRRKGSGWKR
jgi:hypothetical protein